jgi:hypothetical protein
MDKTKNPILEIPVLEPNMQIDFYHRLQALNELYLFDALKKTVAQLDLSIIDKQLYDYVDQESLKKVAFFGLRGEIFFPIPYIIESNPNLLGYYRLLFGFSKKKFYNKDIFGRFNLLEERDTIASDLMPYIPKLCSSLIKTAQILINGLNNISLSTVHDLQVLTIGAALRGGANNDIGAIAVTSIFNLIKCIVDPYITEIGEKHIKIKNDSNRTINIKFLSDPDIHISEKIGKTVRPLLSIEIKGGRDESNIFNRLGEAEKSHRTALGKGFYEFWTIIGVEVNLNRAKEKSPTTSVFFNLDKIQNPESEEYQTFRDLLSSSLSIQIKDSIPSKN